MGAAHNDVVMSALHPIRPQLCKQGSHHCAVANVKSGAEVRNCNKLLLWHLTETLWPCTGLFAQHPIHHSSDLLCQALPLL